MNLPSVDQIRSMTPDEAEEALVATTSILPLLVAKAREPRPSNLPETMTVKEAAERAGVSPYYFYDHWKELPFCSKLGRSVKINRGGFAQWIATKQSV